MQKVYKSILTLGQNKIKQTGVLGISIMLILLVFCQPVFCQNYNFDSDLLWLEKELEQSRYNGFQTKMVLKATEELLALDVNEQEVYKVLTGSINTRFDAYNIKKILVWN